jgi:hypothetical protein
LLADNSLVIEIENGEKMRYSAALLAVVVTLVLARLVSAASFAGEYSDGQLTVHLSDSAGALTGTLSLNGQQFPATASVNGSGLNGTFKSGDDSFPFTATLDGDTMTLTTGGKAYTLKRVSHANPLAGGAANPLAQPAGGKDAPDGYTVVATTDSGKSWVTTKTGITSVQSALEATLPELARFFGAKISIGRAYENVNDHNSGGATFTSTQNGQPIRGIISAKLADNQGATVAVIFARSDAPKADWDKLANPSGGAQAQDSPAQGNSGGSPTLDEAAIDAKVAAAAKVLGDSAKVYQYPDGTGSIILADGWTTQAKSMLDATFIKGPADQSIGINAGVIIQSPDSPMMKMMAQNEAMAAKNAAAMKQMGVNYTPPPPPPKPFMLVATFSDPVQAMNDLVPQLNQFNQSKGLPTTHIDQIILHKDVQYPTPGAKAAIVEWLATRTTADGTATQYHNRSGIIITPIQQGALTWSYTTNGYSAPVATYDHDQPIMQAMIDSMKIDKQAFDQVAQQRMQEIQQQGQANMAMSRQMAAAQNAQMQANHEQFMQDQQTRFDIGQEQHQAQEDSYAQHNEQFNEDELAKARNKDNFVETIQGTRTVYDTQTGESTKVDLMSAGAIVDQLNQDTLDPNRFVQIPLRDEMDPVPAGQ